MARGRAWGSFPTTADVGIWARGEDAEALLEALGIGLFALITDLRKVRPRVRRRITAHGADLPALVVAYLGELLLLQQTEGFLARQIEPRLQGRPPTKVTALVRGEIFDPGQHSRRKEVKAVTYHRLEFDVARGRARVIIDI